MIKVKKLEPTATLPVKQSYSEGYEIRTCEAVEVKKDKPQLIRTGLAVELPPGCAIKFCGISQAAGAPFDLFVVGGMILPDQFEEWGVVVQNLTDDKIDLLQGDLFAQALIIQTETFDVVEVTTVPEPVI